MAARAAMPSPGRPPCGLRMRAWRWAALCPRCRLTASRRSAKAGTEQTAALAAMRASPASRAIGRASGRDRVWQYVEITVVPVSLKKRNSHTKQVKHKQALAAIEQRRDKYDRNNR